MGLVDRRGGMDAAPFRASGVEGLRASEDTDTGGTGLTPLVEASSGGWAAGRGSGGAMGDERAYQTSAFRHPDGAAPLAQFPDTDVMVPSG